MAYKTILLCLNEVARLPALIEAAEQLGTRFKAHIAGLYVIPAVQVYPSSGYGAVTDYFDGNRIYFQNHQAKVIETFEAAMKRAGLSFDTHVVDSNFSDIGSDVVDNARAADLVVISNIDRDGSQGVETDFVERFVIAAGRPVVVLPYKGKIDLKAEQVMAGWNDSREASRAVFDALPFLVKAKQTRLVTVDVAPRGNLPAAGIAETLDRHGIKAVITDVSSDGMSVGETLLRAAKDHGAELLVLGAYGHSRFSEMVFGGATRHVLHHLDLPVLMSH
jgi:nucleotide-binding universal stress UspA family protein